MSYFRATRLCREARVRAPRVESDFRARDGSLSPKLKAIDRALGVSGLSLGRCPRVVAMGASPPRLTEAQGCPQLGGAGLPLLVDLGPGWEATSEQKAMCPWGF